MARRKCSNVTGEQTFLQIFGWIIGGISLILGSTAYQNDFDWHEIIRGNAHLHLKDEQKITLNLTLQQQLLLARPTSLTSREGVFLIGLSVFLLASIAIYTFLSIRGTQIRPTCVTCIVMTLHAFASIFLAFLCYTMLRAKTDVSKQERDVCSGRYKNILSQTTNGEIVEFIRESFCVCCAKETKIIFRNILYNSGSLEDLKICQSVLLKQIAAILLLLYMMITLVLSCTQFKDLMVMSSAVAISPTSPNHPTVIIKKAEETLKCNNNNKHTTDIKIEMENNNENELNEFRESLINPTANDMYPALLLFPGVNSENSERNRKVQNCSSDASFISECVCSNINNNLEDEDVANDNVKSVSHSNEKLGHIPVIEIRSPVESEDGLSSFW